MTAAQLQHPGKLLARPDTCKVSKTLQAKIKELWQKIKQIAKCRNIEQTSEQKSMMAKFP
jgi:hypothetical protein